MKVLKKTPHANKQNTQKKPKQNTTTHRKKQPSTGIALMTSIEMHSPISPSPTLGKPDLEQDIKCILLFSCIFSTHIA